MLQGDPHFHRERGPGTRAGSRWTSLGPVTRDTIRIISGNFIIQYESLDVWQHTRGPFRDWKVLAWR